MRHRLVLHVAAIIHRRGYERELTGTAKGKTEVSRLWSLARHSIFSLGRTRGVDPNASMKKLKLSKRRMVPFRAYVCGGSPREWAPALCLRPRGTRFFTTEGTDKNARLRS